MESMRNGVWANMTESGMIGADRDYDLTYLGRTNKTTRTGEC